MSVKVQYTIPGWEPSPAPAPRLDSAPSVFETRLREAAVPVMPGWQRLLRADSPSPGDLVLPPPPRPRSHDYTDSQEDSRRWQGLLRRHGASTGNTAPEVCQMLEVIARMDEDELELYSRVISEIGG